MRTRPNIVRLRNSVLAVHGALALLASAQAQTPTDPVLKQLTEPDAQVEIGVIAASGAAAKAFEYNGLTSKSATLFGHIDLHGNQSWDSEDNTRWSIVGADLGTQSPSLQAQFGKQGIFKVKLGFEQIRRNQSDSYQTPFLGVGTNVLRLPPNWVTPVVPRVNATAPNARGLSPEVTASPTLAAGVLTAPTPAQLATAAALQSADLAAIRQVDLFTTRSNYNIGLEHQIDTRWSWRVGMAHEHKEGLKATPGPTRITGDTTAILPAPIDQDDEKIEAGVAYTANELQLQAGYEASAFRNNVKSLTFSLWANAAQSATSATAPSNLFQKFTLSGAYQASSATRLVAAAGYARTTQSDPYVMNDASPNLTPVNNAAAAVSNKTLSLKALHRASDELRLSAGYKYEDRKNGTPVNVYGFYDLNNAPNAAPSPFAYLYPAAQYPGLAGIGANFNFNANTPYSKRSHQFDLEADYKLGADQHLKAEWQTQQIDRSCAGSWINCADAPHSTEHTLRGDWIGNLGEDVSARLGVTAAQRKVDYDEDAFLAVVPMANASPSTATGALAGTTAYGALVALGLTGYGPVSGLTPAAAAGSLQAFYFPLNNVLSNTLYGNGNRISELVGLRRYNQANRDRTKLRASANWQLSERIGLQGGLDANDDHYSESVYGLQRVRGWAMNLDATYAAGVNTSVNVFSNYESQQTRTAGNSYTANSAATNVNGATAISGGCYATIALRNASNKVDACNDWSSSTHDNTLTLGATATRSKLLSGKLDLTGGVVYSMARTTIHVAGGSYVNNPYAGIAGNPTSAIAAYYVPASDLPTNIVKSLDLRLGGTWRFDDQRALRLAYGYQRMASSDWGYEGYQASAATQFLATFERTPRHEVHTIGISYVMGLR